MYVFNIKKKWEYLNKRMLNPFFHRPVPPQEILGIDNERRVCGMIFSIRQELIGSFWIPVPQDVLAKLKQLARNVVVHGQVAGVDNRCKKMVSCFGSFKYVKTFKNANTVGI